MKILKSSIVTLASFLVLLSTLPLITSCGTDMRDWPYIELGFKCDSVDKIFIEYLNNESDDKSKKFSLDNETAIENIYNLLEDTHVSPKSTTKDLQNYNKKVSIYFFASDTIWDFKAYIFGLDTYFLYNDEIRQFPVDFESVFLGAIDNLSDSLIKIK